MASPPVYSLLQEHTMCSPSSYVGWTDFDACVYQARISGAGLFQWTPGEDEGGCKLCPDGLDGEMKSTKANFALYEVLPYPPFPPQPPAALPTSLRHAVATRPTPSERS